MRISDWSSDVCSSDLGGTKADYAISRAHNLNFGARYDREVESRADPEATTDPDLSPRKIDLLSGDIGYRYQMNRIGISLQGGVQRQNYLPSAETDSDKHGRESCRERVCKYVLISVVADTVKKHRKTYKEKRKKD